MTGKGLQADIRSRTTCALEIGIFQDYYQYISLCFGLPGYKDVFGRDILVPSYTPQQLSKIGIVGVGCGDTNPHDGHGRCLKLNLKSTIYHYFG